VVKVVKGKRERDKEIKSLTSGILDNFLAELCGLVLLCVITHWLLHEV
jgi:hypothetical protein